MHRLHVWRARQYWVQPQEPAGVLTFAVKEAQARLPLAPLANLYFVALQAQPAPHWQVLLHPQRSPQMQRDVTAFAHPHDAFSHRHCFWVSFVIGSLLFAARCLRAVTEANAYRTASLHLAGGASNRRRVAQPSGNQVICLPIVTRGSSPVPLPAQVFPVFLSLHLQRQRRPYRLVLGSDDRMQVDPACGALSFGCPIVRVRNRKLVNSGSQCPYCADVETDDLTNSAT